MAVPYADVARRVAAKLASGANASLPALTERVLADGSTGDQATRYEPASLISLAALVVSATGVGWNIYSGLRNEKKKAQETSESASSPTHISRRQVLVRQIRVGLASQPHHKENHIDEDRVIEAVVQELLMIDEHHE